MRIYLLRLGAEITTQGYSVKSLQKLKDTKSYGGELVYAAGKVEVSGITSFSFNTEEKTTRTTLFPFAPSATRISILGCGATDKGG